MDTKSTVWGFPIITGLSLLFIIFILPVCYAEEVKELIYDANGNLVTGDGYYREYNSFNQLFKVYEGSDNTTLREQYEYHPTEERVIKKLVFNETGGWKESIYYPTKEWVQVINSSGTYNYHYVYSDDQLIAQLNPDSSKYFYYNDHLGSNTMLLDEAGNLVENTNYHPFGGIESGGESSRYDYEGKEMGSAVPEYDYHARKYNPDLRMFTQPDMSLSRVYDPKSLNRYSFELNNPYKNADSNGHEPVTITTALTLYTVVETTLDIVSLSISTIDMVQDSTDVDNQISFELDMVDLLSGPFSNPGPSGAMYKWFGGTLLTEKQIARARATVLGIEYLAPEIGQEDKTENEDGSTDRTLSIYVDDLGNEHLFYVQGGQSEIRIKLSSGGGSSSEYWSNIIPTGRTDKYGRPIYERRPDSESKSENKK